MPNMLGTLNIYRNENRMAAVVNDTLFFYQDDKPVGFVRIDDPVKACHQIIAYMERSQLPTDMEKLGEKE